MCTELYAFLFFIFLSCNLPTLKLLVFFLFFHNLFSLFFNIFFSLFSLLALESYNLFLIQSAKDTFAKYVHFEWTSEECLRWILKCSVSARFAEWERNREVVWSSSPCFISTKRQGRLPSQVNFVKFISLFLALSSVHLHYRAWRCCYGVFVLLGEGEIKKWWGRVNWRKFIKSELWEKVLKEEKLVEDFVGELSKRDELHLNKKLKESKISKEILFYFHWTKIDVVLIT